MEIKHRTFKTSRSLTFYLSTQTYGPDRLVVEHTRNLFLSKTSDNYSTHKLPGNYEGVVYITELKNYSRQDPGNV